MSTEVVFRHGTTASRMAMTPALGEIGSDDETKQIILGDGVTPGGIPMARDDKPLPDGAVTFSKLAAELKGTTQSVSANTQLTLTHRNRLINVDAQAAARTITLPAAATAGDGFVVTVRNANAANFVTVAASGAELIDGVSTFKLTLTGHIAVFRCNGTSWNVVAEAGTLETGTNANGTYYKRADGSLVCIGTGPGVAATTAQGSMFVGDEACTYPYAFVGSPAPLPTARVQSSNRLVNSRAATTAAVTIRHFSTISDSVVISASYRVEGRWF